MVAVASATVSAPTTQIQIVKNNNLICKCFFFVEIVELCDTCGTNDLISNFSCFFCFFLFFRRKTLKAKIPLKSHPTNRKSSQFRHFIFFLLLFFGSKIYKDYLRPSPVQPFEAEFDAITHKTLAGKHFHCIA